MFGYPFCDMSWPSRECAEHITLDFLAHAGGARTGPEPDAICAFLDQALVGLGGAAPTERSAAAYRKQWEVAPNQRVR